MEFQWKNAILAEMLSTWVTINTWEVIKQVRQSNEQYASRAWLQSAVICIDIINAAQRRAVKASFQPMKTTRKASRGRGVDQPTCWAQELLISNHIAADYRQLTGYYTVVVVIYI